MERNTDQKGLIYMAVEELLQMIEMNKGILKAHSLHVSLLEVHKEKIKDLSVANSRGLEVYQTALGSQEVKGLKELRVKNSEQVWLTLAECFRISSKKKPLHIVEFLFSLF
ncbi:unnamed protein product [Microthlaspi erraticum]|uniref:Kinesin motor domain-containing protein n=1 Tax=Microthlaspi erraticum TaxID=1685480 RepID=A0A6D2HIC1_9BRAS|nr:unnamed protein product [Microthlaspi erraticum]